MTEFAHLGFKIICTLFMARTVYHYHIKESHIYEKWLRVYNNSHVTKISP
jgi:hypothetical protein